jgi:dihydrofolate synthase/folylpolyglutamate synthase
LTTPPWRAATPREYLASLEHFGIKLGLETTRLVCAALGDPQERYPTILIGGTNGKGSVAAFSDEALRSAAYRVGRYTSPHLLRLEERFHVNGAPVESTRLDSALDEVRSAVGRLQDARRLDVHPTYFEVTTAAAFLLFARAEVDVAVIEVGLGGRFDATNILTPRVACITSIARDHEVQLGSTLADIAREKAGIVKTGVPVVIGELPGEARHVVAAACRDRGAPLVDAFEGTRARIGIDGDLTTLTLGTRTRDYGTMRLSLRGEHQAGNAVVAVRLLETLDAAGIPVPEPAVRAGLESAQWPGRLDLRTLSDGRRLLVDGAHNPAGAAALARYLRRQWPGGLPIVFGAMQDKDLTGMVSELAAVARPLLLTQAPGRRAASVTQLAAAAAAAGAAAPILEADIPSALERAWSMAQTIAVAGSLYLAGAALGCVERE